MINYSIFKDFAQKKRNISAVQWKNIMKKEFKKILT
jgi:hypothetical protein